MAKKKPAKKPSRGTKRRPGTRASKAGKKAARKTGKSPGQRKQAALEELAAEVRRLHALEPGASPDHPIEVRSTSQIEPQARSLRCLLCDQGLQIADQRAYVGGGRVFRALTLRCPRCGEAREVHFVALPPLAH